MMYLKERLNDHANILVDIRDELEIKSWLASISTRTATLTLSNYNNNNNKSTNQA
jgi:hypothetical protein